MSAPVLRPQSAPSPRKARLAGAVFAALALGSPLFAQSPPGPPPPPQPGSGRFPAPVPSSPIRMEPEAIELGIVEPGSTHRRTFRIVNDGPVPLLVRAASPSCRCTTVDDIVGKQVPAKGFLELEAEFAAPPTPGYKDAKVNVVLEGAPRPLVAKIGGDVTLPIRVTPAFVDALNGRMAGSVTLSAIDGRPFRVISAGGKEPVFAGPAPTGPQAVQRLAWNVAGISCERMPLWWIVITDHPDCPVVPLRIRHDCTGSKADMGRYARYWIPKDQLVNLGRVRVGSPTTAELQLDHYNPRGRGRIVRPDFREVRRVEVDAPELEIELLAARPVAEDAVVLSFAVTPRAGTAGPIATTMRITTATGTGEVPLVVVVEP
ncbi:MAG: DUF1573 domain-containing protein [Phycisphaerales bacterium]